MVQAVLILLWISSGLGEFKGHMAAENGRVHPNCLNASNPYHECGMACLEKIAQGHGHKETPKKKLGNYFCQNCRMFQHFWSRMRVPRLVFFVFYISWVILRGGKFSSSFLDWLWCYLLLDEKLYFRNISLTKLKFQLVLHCYFDIFCHKSFLKACISLWFIRLHFNFWCNFDMLVKSHVKSVAFSFTKFWMAIKLIMI